MTAHRRPALTLSHEFPALREEVISLVVINTCFGTIEESALRIVDDTAREADAVACELSVRALNVLKLMAAELTGESPPRKEWVPSTEFLQKVTFERLLNARNCGPLTMEEIIRCARSRGVMIAPRSCVGKSLSEMWRYLEARFAAGELTQAELAEALERSVRRKSRKIPLAVQRILLRLLGRLNNDRPGV